MPSEAVARDEFETVKQLLASAASYAESANKQADRNAVTIADNNQGIAELKDAQQRTQTQIDANAQAIASNNQGIAELKETQQANAQAIADTNQSIKEAQDRTQRQLDELSQKQDRTQQQLDALGQRVDSFVFESQRLIADNKSTITRLDAMIERYDGVLAYLMRKESGED